MLGSFDDVNPASEGEAVVLDLGSSLGVHTGLTVAELSSLYDSVPGIGECIHGSADSSLCILRVALDLGAAERRESSSHVTQLAAADRGCAWRWCARWSRAGWESEVAVAGEAIGARVGADVLRKKTLEGSCIFAVDLAECQ